METVYIEINGAAGGEEGNLFAADLARMYEMWAGKNKIKVKRIELSPIVLQCRGENAYSVFAYEGGVHRVQRVPETEKRGRVHTSTVTVNVFKETQRQKVIIRPEDIEFSTCRSSGAGGQHVNRTNSKVRLVHRPTGITVECQEERSQAMNREKAMQKLQEILERNQHQQIINSAAENKRQQVGNGDRSEKIRTYNEPQNLVTDHRCKYKKKDYKGFLNGKYFTELYQQLQENLTS